MTDKPDDDFYTNASRVEYAMEVKKNSGGQEAITLTLSLNVAALKVIAKSNLLARVVPKECPADVLDIARLLVAWTEALQFMSAESDREILIKMPEAKQEAAC